MKWVKTVLLSLFVVLPSMLLSQTKEVYNTQADANADIKNAIELAQNESKNIFLQIGGNWCPWCIKFHHFIEDDAELKTYLNDNFRVVKVNYDRENRQETLFENLGFPQRFGFPVFVVLDSNGKRIHTQNSAYLEKDKSYDRETVLKFLKNWSPTAINPESYKK